MRTRRHPTHRLALPWAALAGFLAVFAGLLVSLPLHDVATIHTAQVGSTQSATNVFGRRRPAFHALTELNRDQELIVATFELDLRRVKTLLAEGADPNARLGFYDRHLFADKWTLACSQIGSDNWTVLQALANSHRAPQPDKPAENTSDGLDKARAAERAIDRRIIDQRDRRRVEIAQLLIAAKADLDLDDGYGSTALYSAIYNDYESLALLLIQSGAEVNTKTHVYIDGSDDITPLHRAVDHPKVVAALLKRGANVDARTSEGTTPLHWAVLMGNAQSAKLLLAAGADPEAKDEEGNVPHDFNRGNFLESLSK